MAAKKNSRFMMGMVAVASVVTYLGFTGVRDSMTYSTTPQELVAKISGDPTFRDMGVEVTAKVVPNTYEKSEGGQLHKFTVKDADNADVTFRVEYKGMVPDTFRPAEEMDIVMKGRLDADGVFHATEVVTKCASRYEATDKAVAG
jgi:cytochrome c-type biogenesis protein CcmE